ncbi:IS66-like element accessory protein TnpA [Bradyrhizobium barranii]|uniref:IS66-like element accessory protein TnpA n=1 Tax=Bradyrhizobium barranii TaxID=2992140 RepID=UPI0031339FD3
MFDHTLKSDVTARRLEVITETGRRRWFSKDDKARIVEETLVPGAVVSEIARRHGLTPQQVFTWRRQARRQPAPMANDPQFVPAVVSVWWSATMWVANILSKPAPVIFDILSWSAFCFAFGPPGEFIPSAWAAFNAF